MCQDYGPQAHAPSQEHHKVCGLNLSSLLDIFYTCSEADIPEETAESDRERLKLMKDAHFANVESDSTRTPF